MLKDEKHQKKSSHTDHLFKSTKTADLTLNGSFRFCSQLLKKQEQTFFHSDSEIWKVSLIHPLTNPRRVKIS